MGAKSRRKGAQGERELAALAREVGFKDAKRTAPMQAGHGDNEYADVGSIPGLYVESKRYEKTPVGRFADEVLVPRQDGLQPVLMYRDNGKPWRAVVDGKFLLALWKECQDLRGALGMVAQGTGIQA